jgi:hypothetical protein
MPIDVRSTSLAVLALIAAIVFLHWAQAVLIPIVFAVLLSYALTPVVDWLKRRAKLHKAVGAALTLAALLGGLGAGLGLGRGLGVAPGLKVAAGLDDTPGLTVESVEPACVALGRGD